MRLKQSEDRETAGMIRKAKGEDQGGTTGHVQVGRLGKVFSTEVT